MKLPDLVKKTRDLYVAKFPVPRIPPHTEEKLDDALREWTERFDRQVVFTTKDARYGMKRADPGRPKGKDTLAMLDGDVIHIWDLLTGASGGQGAISPDPDSIDVPIYPAKIERAGVVIEGQVFIPVEPLDSLGGVVVPPPPVPVGKTLTEYFKIGTLIRRLYKEELSRDILSDPDALVNWLFHWRESGKDEAWMRARIRESDEWKAGHP